MRFYHFFLKIRHTENTGFGFGVREDATASELSRATHNEMDLVFAVLDIALAVRTLFVFRLHFIILIISCVRMKKIMINSNQINKSSAFLLSPSSYVEKSVWSFYSIYNGYLREGVSFSFISSSPGRVNPRNPKQIDNKTQNSKHMYPIPNYFIRNYAERATRKVSNQLTIITGPVLSSNLAA